MTIEFQLKQLSLDIEELLGYIQMLEERILKLESRDSAQKLVRHEDSWYWEHG